MLGSNGKDRNGNEDPCEQCAPFEKKRGALARGENALTLEMRV